MNHGQALPGSFADGFGGVKRLENSLQVFIVNAAAIVRDLDDHAVMFASGYDFDFAQIEVCACVNRMSCIDNDV